MRVIDWLLPPPRLTVRLLPPVKSVVEIERLPWMVYVYALLGLAIGPSVLVKAPDMVQLLPGVTELVLVLLMVREVNVPPKSEQLSVTATVPSKVRAALFRVWVAVALKE